MNLNVTFTAAGGSHLFSSSTLAEQWIVLAKGDSTGQIVLDQDDYLEFSVSATVGGVTAKDYSYSWLLATGESAILATNSADSGNAIGYIAFASLAEVKATGTALYRKI